MNGSLYLTGRTPFLACQADPRFSYCLYVPQEIRQICVYIHGTYRDATLYRDHLQDFAENHRVLIVSPLFPAGIIDPEDVDNYKHLLYHDIRFDQILLHMLDEIRERYGIANQRFLLGGFSGGAQFAHRFAYLHPERVRALSLAAPGRVTLLDETLDWWAGIRDIETLFEQSIDIELLKNLPIQLLVGQEDNADITIQEDSPYWVHGANRAGTTRHERLVSLHQQYHQMGCDVCLKIVDNCGHEWLPLKLPVINFFETIVA
jgi:pimeloyl-ACP methyl ester carboxylesterase